MQRKEKDKVIIGIIAATLLPIIAYVSLTIIFNGLEEAGLASTEGFSPYFRERTTGIVAIGTNAILMNYLSKLRHRHSIRGVVLPTFIYIGLWVYYFKDIVLG
jgi:multisubunit Na+/H+ antiporter MnhB subunit